MVASNTCNITGENLPALCTISPYLHWKYLAFVSLDCVVASPQPHTVVANTHPVITTTPTLSSSSLASLLKQVFQVMAEILSCP